jgi:hypothetical protein
MERPNREMFQSLATDNQPPSAPNTTHQSVRIASLQGKPKPPIETYADECPTKKALLSVGDRIPGCDGSIGDRIAEIHRGTNAAIQHGRRADDQSAGGWSIDTDLHG